MFYLRSSPSPTLHRDDSVGLRRSVVCVLRPQQFLSPSLDARLHALALRDYVLDATHSAWPGVVATYRQRWLQD
jgi:hypothetical protein